LTIISPIEGTPAYRAGLKPGDRIVKIEDRSTEGITLDEAVSKLRGRPGTKVEITIQRPGLEELKEYAITREIIKIRAVPYAGLVAPDVGYVRLAGFSKTARDELAAAIDSLFNLGAKKIVLDLRGNSGGLLKEGIEVSDHFLEPGQVVVKTRGRLREANKDFQGIRELLHGDYPLVILTDAWSASASEIVAGAIQDWERGLILGDTTYGKGSVQTLYPIETGGGLKLTTAYWYTPSGRCIDRAIKEDTLARAQFIREERYFSLGKRHREVYGEGGIVPDLVVEMPELPKFVEKLDRDYFFEFSARYAKLGLKPDFVVTPEMFEEFKELLKKKEIELTDAQFDSSLQFIEQRIKQEIAGRLWGDRGRYEVGLFPYDPQLAQTLEILAQVDSTPDLFRFAAH
jgi:carboxyl-terminal processing protease